MRLFMYAFWACELLRAQKGDRMSIGDHDA